MYRAYGGWTFAFKDYLDMNISKYLDDPRLDQLAAIVDPYCENTSIDQAAPITFLQPFHYIQ